MVEPGTALGSVKVSLVATSAVVGDIAAIFCFVERNQHVRKQNQETNILEHQKKHVKAKTHSDTDRSTVRASDTMVGVLHILYANSMYI